MRRIELGAKTLALILAVCAGTVSSAQPKDPPAWWGTNDGLTSIFSWKFQPNDPDPRKLSLEHGVIAPWGVPDWTFGGDSPPEWYDEWKGGNPNGDVIEPNRGVYGVGTSLTGSIELNIHNAPDPRRIKYVWVQFDRYQGKPNEANPGKVTPTLRDADGRPAITLSDPRDINEDILLPNGAKSGWLRTSILFKIDPQPAREYLRFDFEGRDTGAAIDNLHVGTHCVPEPMTLLGMATGLLALARRRR